LGVSAKDSNIGNFAAQILQMLLSHRGQNLVDRYKCEAHRAIGDAVGQEEIIANADRSARVDDVRNIAFTVFISSR
jgi:hypothetical protein